MFQELLAEAVEQAHRTYPDFSERPGYERSRVADAERMIACGSEEQCRSMLAFLVFRSQSSYEAGRMEEPAKRLYRRAQKALKGG